MIRCLILLVFALTLLSGCAPRGESKSLDEVYQIAKSRYESAIVDTKAVAETRESLSQVVKDINGFVAASSSSDVKVAAASITKELEGLIETTGYTTRPAMNEIMKSYRGLAAPAERESGGESWNLDAPAKKLLAARTYTVLAQELETTSFGVMPKGAA